MTDPIQPPIYVLDGIAGIGKSTVAQTIATHSADLGYLGASFFFSKDDIDRKTAKLFFSTLAFQLSRYDGEFAKVIGEALEHAPDASEKILGQQSKLLLVDPLQQLSRSHPTLLVIDAMDECDQEEAKIILTLLASEVKKLPNFKIFVTTRPEPYLHDTVFGHQSPYHTSFHLHEIESHVVEADICLYFTHGLSREQVQKALPNPKAEWNPTTTEFDDLLKIVGKLFIIASTAIRFILDKRTNNPMSQMKKLISAFQEGKTLGPTAILDKTYMEILLSAIPEDSDPELISNFQDVIGTVIVLEIPLSLSSLASFIGMNVETLKTALLYLHSVIVSGSNDQAPQVYHKSFPDFITDKNRCVDSHFYIAPDEHHAKAAEYCFKVMSKLHKNMYDLDEQQMNLRNNEIHGLGNDKISEELIYACLHWAIHLSKAGIHQKATLVDQLKSFAFEHLLHWMEVLSLTGKLDSAHPTLILGQKYVVSKLLVLTYQNVNENTR